MNNEQVDLDLCGSNLTLLLGPGEEQLAATVVHYSKTAQELIKLQHDHTLRLLKTESLQTK